MKKSVLFFFIFFSIVSCSDSEDSASASEPVLEETLAASPDTFYFEAAGGTDTFRISSNAIWNIDFTSDSWVYPSIQTAQGDARVILTAAVNSSGKERDTTLTVATSAVATVLLKIQQDGNLVLPDSIAPDASGMRDLTALDFSRLMGAGWNLGNSLEAISVNNGIYSGNETSWGNPVVTKELIDSVKAAGFTTVRIPVSWSNHMDATDDYKIDDSWKERVARVVQYVLDDDMYAIINIHWDGGWMNHPDDDHQDSINGKLKAMWKQIAVYFRNDGDHLLFAGTNEVHVENNYDAPTAENAAVQNSLNQTFVNAVRSTGGKNIYRQLIIQSYNTNAQYAVSDLVMPKDPTDNRLMVEIHFYDPYDFALQEDDGYKTQWGKPFTGGDVSSWGQEDWVDEMFGHLKTTFVDKGIPVIMGEFGALLRTGLGDREANHIKARNYYLNDVAKTAVADGIVPVYWDNGVTGNNGFGLFDRSDGRVIHQDAVAAIISALKK